EAGRASPSQSIDGMPKSAAGGGRPAPRAPGSAPGRGRPAASGAGGSTTSGAPPPRAPPPLSPPHNAARPNPAAPPLRDRRGTSSWRGGGRRGLGGSLWERPGKSPPGRPPPPPAVPTHSWLLSKTPNARPDPTFTTTLFVHVVSAFRDAKSTYTHSASESQRK